MAEELRHWDRLDAGRLGRGEGRMHVVAAGVNHQTAPVEVRERIAFGPGNLKDALLALRQRAGIGEAAILSTCNRTELYVACADAERAGGDIVEFLATFHAVEFATLEPHLYGHTDAAAARHLFRVAAGLDSMILGEGQILAQVRGAMQAASRAGTVRTYLHELFQRGLHVGKKARSETAIHRGAVSVSSAAVELAKSVFGDLRGREALVVGAGEMSEQTLKHLVEQGVDSIVVANRTHERAVALAESYRGAAIRFDDFPQRLASVDIIISSSAAPHPILTVERLKPHLAARRGRPLFLIDIAVPRDVETAVADLPNVYLFDIDDLSSVADRYRESRAREAVKVEDLVAAEIVGFMDWLESRRSMPLIVELRRQVETIRDEELERWLRKLPELDEAQREVVRQMMRSFGNKLLHGPMTEIRKHAGSEDETAYAELVRRLFSLDGSGGR